MMKLLQELTDDNFIWIYFITAASIAVVLTDIFSLSHGINDIFPYFFLIPVILGAYVFPHRGVMITIILAWIYITTVFVLGTFSPRIIAVHTAWFFIYVSLGVVISHFAESSRARKKQADIIKKEALHQIEQNMEQFAILNDTIRNPLQAILLDASTLDDEKMTLIADQVIIIEKTLDLLDEKYLESEKVRKFLHTHHGFGEY